MNKKKQLVAENPFYGLKALFALYQNKAKGIISSFLSAAWNEIKDNELGKQLFHIISFSIGDISNRHHNIFGKSKIEGGGEANNDRWIEYLQWLLNHNPKQFVAFLPLIVEYVGLRELVSWQIKTQKGKSKIVGVWGLLGIIQANKIAYEGLLNYLVKSINGNNPFLKHQIAKFVKIPRHSKRIKKDKEGKVVGKRNLQANTIAKMQAYGTLISNLSERMGWETEFKETHIEYTGYRNWQKQYNQDLEFVLFSTGKINEFDKETFTNWINQLPSGARFRVRKRLFNYQDTIIPKWSKLAKWFAEWEKVKENLQQEQRNLEHKARVSTLTDEEKEKLAKVKKDAKVTTGGISLFSMIDDLISGKASSITIQSIVDKVTFDVPILPIVDISGSMNGRPTLIARLITTLALLKNPNTMDNLLFRFGSVSDCITDNSIGQSSANKFMNKSSLVVKKLIDRTQTFAENFDRLGAFVHSGGGNTNISGLAERMREWVHQVNDDVVKQHRIEQINEYQVFLVVSDGDLNNSHSAATSMTDFIMKMKQWFGWDGVVVLWDVPKFGDSVNKSGYFDNIENVIHVTTYNMSTINQIFTKITDLDVIDIYTPLKSLYASNRYEFVKESVI